MVKRIKSFFEGGPVGVLTFVAGLVGLLMILSWIVDEKETTKIMSHSDFLHGVEAKQIKIAKIENGHVLGKTIDGKRFEAMVHMTDKTWDMLHENNVEIAVGDDFSSGGSGESWYLWIIGAVIVIGLLIWFFMKKSQGSGGVSSIFSFGKSRFRKLLPGEIQTTFSDVAGAASAKEALMDVVDFLRDPEKFKKLGARIHKGILLAGEPGNGKTLLARAVAGEANCSFLSIHGADFIEVFVGVGAARIRDLFSQARKNVPCILFIDEIDAIGRARGSGTGGGHDEREQTLNQLLTEMDGFDQFKQSLIVIAATNIPEVLDKALLRPGRFDRIVYVPYPNLDARCELLRIHSRKVPLGANVNFDSLASLTQGLSGADLENLVNIAALYASREQRSLVEHSDFERAYRDILNGKRDIQSSASDLVKEFLPQQVKTKFLDVAGLEDAKEDLSEVVDFLKDPKKYTDIGARIPSGVLLCGEPGNGKTLLARAVAGEAGVPFYYASGSQFIQKYVGVGAERIRDLFNQARKQAPAIIFIDELDSIGKRSEESDGGNSERNQTINQLLTEMDGFSTEGQQIVVLAATNMKDSIDNALKRGGRFDRIIDIPYPNLRARGKILQVHARGKKFDTSVNLDDLARGTAGFAGAALESLLNEAAILAVSSKKTEISLREIEEAKDRVMLGKKMIGLTQTADNLKRTAYHEAGHALASVMQPDYPYAFHKVTILSRGNALGVSHSLPYDDVVSLTREQLEATIVTTLAGRAAEVLIFERVCTGASSDFQKATNTAAKMVCLWGMSEEIGVISFADNYERVSQETKREIDKAIQRIVNSLFEKTMKLLSENRTILENIAESLLKEETLDAEKVYNIAGVSLPAKKKLEDPEVL